MLHSFQTEFKDFITNQEIGRALTNAILEGNISISERLGIYRNTVMKNLTNALKITYPKFVILVGEEFFEFLAYEFIKQHLPSSGSLLHYGDRFPEFVKDFNQLAAFPYARDFARLEWLYHECHHAIAEEALTIDDLAANLQADLSYLPQIKQCVRFFYSSHPIKQLWDICLTQKEEELIIKGSGILLNKREWVVEIISISKLEYEFLEAIFNKFTSIDGVNDKQLAEIITKFVSLGIFKR